MNKSLRIFCGAALALGLGVISANATMYNYTFTGSDGDGALDATASFNLSGNTVTITLNNLEANPTAAGQLISGIIFTATGSTGASLTSSSGVLANIGTGVLSNGVAQTLEHWGLSSSGALVTLETAGNAAQGGAPHDMIIGPDSLGGFSPTNYPNANPSITGNHQPSVLGSATFVVTLDGTVTGLSGVSMAFGTGPDAYLDGTPGSVPDNGSTVALLGFAMIGMVVVSRKFRPATVRA